MTEGKAGKVRLTFCIILVGMALMLAAVVTDHWAVLSPKLDSFNTTCEAAHFGLWRLCTKKIYVQEPDPKNQGCGPISLPGGHNCTYFKHFTSGENAEIFEVTTQKEYSISAAAISIIGVGFMILGTICILLSFRQKLDYLLKPAAMFYTFAGLCIIISVEVIRQSVKRMIDSEDTVWIVYYYSWSFACACSAFVLLFICGIALLLISLPRMPQNPWETCMDAEPEQ
ncbi:voltage-dependent calcium channel gamma-1 subunit [Latimeria chalumnae]|uniref:Voltage-dependent calcium channel gamma-1 subunit n=1 Tax=Latimeria chalumnae TaxID=7897 RepID=H3AQE6_LATCH|nr:PREDICTED: voltage-dependent calcium channel gamma-1 subunit [Latimeria chalumnae]|eukprot:XP_005993780.1 PREDICTED: voltage-dependent calcium channel gamma-1 subunit [Latimeria chalumnae]